MEKSNNRELLFFGLSSLGMQFLPIEAEVLEYDHSKVDDTRTPAKVLGCLTSKLPLNWLSPDCVNVYNPCVPSISLEHKFVSNSTQNEVLMKPFIKAKGAAPVKSYEGYEAI